MRLGVVNGALIGATISKLLPDLRYVPILVAGVLEELNPVIRDAHRQTIIKTDPALLYGCRKAWHAANLLGDSYRIGANFVNK